ncbi:MAG: ChbG/HpnK family deacetylase [Methylophilus sp.]|nr:ChbG/HpnK family deacetylase [Methylophilus sp.]
MHLFAEQALGIFKQMTSIIITADDYAQSAAIDAGILHLIRMGRVTATSCLTLSPRWPVAAQQMTAEIRSLADIGLHLDFTQYPQALKHALPKLIAKTALGMLSRQSILHAIRLQLDAFEDALASAPDYVDGHQHVHQLPQIREVLIEELDRRYAKSMPWIRVANPPYWDGLKAMIIRLLGASALKKLAAEKGLEYTHTLLGVYDFDLNIESYRQKLNLWLANSHTQTSPFALMCHPAIATSTDVDLQDPILSARYVEYAVLASQQFKQMLNDHGIKLVRGHSVGL